MNILIIEDDIFLASKIKDIFEFKVVINRISVCYSFKDFLNQITILSSYDIILTDIKLSKKSLDKNWYDIIKIIRSKNILTPIIVISWINEIDWLRKAFDLWANDYIIKPIRFKELEIRILNFYKNYYFLKLKDCSNKYIYKDLFYDLNLNDFFYKNKKILLTKNSKYILSLFFANPEKLLSENYLTQKIWWDVCFLVNRNLRVNILRLKKSLSPFWLDKRIQNIRWEWYILQSK